MNLKVGVQKVAWRHEVMCVMCMSRRNLKVRRPKQVAPVKIDDLAVAVRDASQQQSMRRTMGAERKLRAMGCCGSAL